MRILILTPEFPPHAGGGILKYYALLAQALRGAGARVSILVSTPFSSFPDYESEGVDVTFIPLEHVHRHADHLSHLAAAPMYRRWLGAGLAAADWIARQGDRFDVIEATDFGLLFAPLVGLPSRPPLVVAFHGSVGQIAAHEPVGTQELDGALARFTEGALLPSADGLYAYSPANAEAWTTQLGREVSFLAPPLALGAAATASEPSGGLVVGRIQSWKGPELLCRALQSVGSRLPDELVVRWVGRDTTSAPDQQSMSRWLAMAYPGVWNRSVIPVGSRGAADVASLQAGSKVVIVPSYWDTFNYTLAEAMALGCVTVASTGAGASYLVETGVNGFRASCDDPMAFGETLLMAYALPPSRRAAVGEAARATVAKALDPAAVARQRLEFFARTCSRPRPSQPAPWARGFLEPSGERTVKGDYLGNVAIRDLAAHLTGRLIRKVAP